MDQEDLDIARNATLAPAVRRSSAAAARLVEPWQTLKMNVAVLLGAPLGEPTWIGVLKSDLKIVLNHERVLEAR